MAGPNIFAIVTSACLNVVRALVAAGADANTPLPPNIPTPPLIIAAQHGLLDVYPLLPDSLARPYGHCDPDAVLAFLRMKDRALRRHELLVCVRQARREQDAGRGDVLHPLLNRLAALPPEVIREYVIPHLR